MMVYPNKEFGIRPRKAPKDMFRKQNYWTQGNREPPPWYVWDTKIPINRSRSEERPPVSKNLHITDEEAHSFGNDVRYYLLTSTLHGLRYIGERKLTWFERYHADQLISEVKQRLPQSILGWSTVSSNIETHPYLGKHIKQLVPVIIRIPMTVFTEVSSPKSQITSLTLRFFWLTAFGCSLVSAGFFILNVYAKWRSSPMIVSINPENMPLSSLPFPALTICNVNQAKKTVAERYWNFGEPVDKKLLQSLCSTKDDSEIFEDDIADSADWDHTRSFLINVTQPCNEMLAQCIWDSVTMNCEDLFNAQLTDEGLCCTFNVVHRNNMFRNPRSLNDLNLTFPSPAVDWTPEDGYPPDAPSDGFPWRPKGIGTQHGLTLILDANIAEYYCASTKSAGFKILLHNPTETPKIRNLGEIYGPGVEARSAIWPRILDAQPTLRTIDIKKRLCLFSSEKNLVFFRTYTLKNCEMECEARAMLDVCKCVYYYMPKNKTTRICGKADAKCYTNMSKIMPNGRDIACEECLPACTEIAYMEQLSTAPLKDMLVEQLAKNLGNRTPQYFTENMLVVHFFFEDNTFMRFTKGEIFGLTEFLSNTGGLLGLCMGFSMMSAVELLYYLTLRAFCMARQRKPRQPFVK